MEIAKTPDCNFGEKPKDFKLKGVDNKIYTLNDFKGRYGTLVMFICNHCPYVNAFIKEIVEDVEYFRTEGIKSVAIMSNDTKNYPEDSFENMILFSKKHKFNFPYLFDETQEVAKSYGAVCTPDFFGYGDWENDGLQYRGRMRELKNLKPVYPTSVRGGKRFKDESELRYNMEKIAMTGEGLEAKYQDPSVGSSIKWFKK